MLQPVMLFFFSTTGCSTTAWALQDSFLQKIGVHISEAAETHSSGATLSEAGAVHIATVGAVHTSEAVEAANQRGLAGVQQAQQTTGRLWVRGKKLGCDGAQGEGNFKADGKGGCCDCNTVMSIGDKADPGCKKKCEEEEEKGGEGGGFREEPPSKKKKEEGDESPPPEHV